MFSQRREKFYRTLIMKYDPEAVQRIIDLKFRIDQILLKAFKKTGMTLIKYIALIAIQKKAGFKSW